MMCYKEMTFCPGPCANTDCFRHKDKIDHEWLKENSYVPVAWFIELPIECDKWIDPNVAA